MDEACCPYELMLKIKAILPEEEWDNPMLEKIKNHEVLLKWLNKGYTLTEYLLSISYNKNNEYMIGILLDKGLI